MSTTAAGAVTAADGDTGAMAAAGAAPRSSTFDFRTAVLTAALTLVTFAIAVATPPLSGPFCVAGCVTYPYTDFASRVPRDFLWMWPALLVTPAFAVLAGSVLEGAPAERRRHGRLGFGFALVATGLLTAVYLVQPLDRAGDAGLIEVDQHVSAEDDILAGQRLPPARADQIGLREGNHGAERPLQPPALRPRWLEVSIPFRLVDAPPLDTLICTFSPLAASSPGFGLWAILLCWWILVPWAMVKHWRRWRRRGEGKEGAAEGQDE